MHSHSSFFFFFFNDTATTEIYTLSLHDALPILRCSRERRPQERERRQDKQFQTHPELQGPEPLREVPRMEVRFARRQSDPWTCLQVVRRSRHAHSLRDTSKQWQVQGSLRSEEHTSELQSRLHLVCRLLLEKKNNEL